MRLKSKLLSLNADKASKTKIYSPANTEELRIPFKVDKIAKVVGKLAQLPTPTSVESPDTRLVTGVLVQNDFKMSLMAAEDLREYAGLTTTTVMCKQRITLSTAGIELIKWALEGTFGVIEEIRSRGKVVENGNEEKAAGGSVDAIDGEIENSDPVTYLVMGCVMVRHHHSGEVEIEWEGNILNDGIADAVLAVLFTVESSPAAVKRRNLLVVSTATLMCRRILQKPFPFLLATLTKSACPDHFRGTVFAALHVSRGSIRLSGQADWSA